MTEPSVCGVPKTTLTFRLMNADATFSDGKSADRTYTAMRGLPIQAYSRYFSDGKWVDNSYENPGTPMDKNGTKFLGWFYKDNSGEEHEFNAATTRVTDKMLVYAKWESSYVVYHNNSSDTYVQSLTKSMTSAEVASYDEIVKANSAFNVSGKTFTGWNTAQDGSGTSYKPGDTIKIKPGSQVDLYAQYEDNNYQVKFSANGGTFSENSIFRNSKYFIIEKDKNGGEVAVLKETAKYGQKLHDLTEKLGLDYNQLKPDTLAKKAGFTLSDSNNWLKSPTATDTIRFDDRPDWIFTRKGDNPEITSDVTYYLKWKLTNKDNANITAKLSGTAGEKSGSDDTNTLDSVNVKAGDEIELAGNIDVKNLKDNIEKIAEKLGVKNRDDYDRITVNFDTSSTLKATLTLPDEVTIPDESKLVVHTNHSEAFDSTKVVNVSSRKKTIEVEFSLKNDIANLANLEKAVESPNLGFTISGLQVAESAKDDFNIQVKFSGDISGYAENVSTDDVRRVRRAAASETAMSTPASALTFNFKLDGSSDIKYALYAVQNLELPGDITTEGAADSIKVRPVVRGDQLNYVGRLDVKEIQDKIEAIAAQYRANTDEEKQKINLSNVKSTFTTTITFPEGLTLPENLKGNVTFTENGLFKIDSVKKADTGNGVTVTLGLKDAFTNFKDLESAVLSVPRILEVSVKGVTVADDAPYDKKFTAVGNVSGSFYGEAKKDNSSKIFAFSWNAVQSTSENSSGKDGLGAGKDENNTTAEDNSITYTVKAPDLNILYGDILVNGDTQNDKVYSVKTGDNVDFTGALDVTSIQMLLPALEAQFGNPDANQITLNKKDGKTTGVDFTMTLNITFPDGITVPSDLKADVQDNSFGDFEIKDTRVNGQHVTVTFGLKDDSVGTYSDLKDRVNSAGTDGKGLMKILLPGLKVTKVGENLTVKMDSLTGTFTSHATHNNTTKLFHFAWETKQSTSKEQSKPLGNGKDFTQAADDNDTIAFTLKAEGGSTPNPPVITKKPVTVNDPPVKKVITGDKPKTADKFTFVLKADPDASKLPSSVSADKMPMPEDANGAQSLQKSVVGAGETEFGDITFMDPGTYAYTISEVNDSLKGYTYDRGVYKVVYEVTEDGDRLVAKRTITRDGKAWDSDTIVFTNKYKKDGKNSDKPDKPDKPKPKPNPNKPKPKPNPNKPDNPFRPVTPNKPVIPKKPTNPVTPGKKTTGKIVRTGDLAQPVAMSMIFGGAAIAATLFVLFRRKTGKPGKDN